MGGSSSKSKPKKNKSENRYDFSHSVDAEGTNTSNNKTSKSSIKKKQKGGSVKIKESKKNLKKSKSFNGRTPDNVDPAVIADMSDSSGKLPVPTSPLYRKKSSCPSCEAKDILLGKNRSRSGSEKSLRFSDFNRVVRKTRIYDWEVSPADIPLYDVPEPKPDDVCYICGVYTGCHVRACRVCCRVYHDGCLSKIGHALNEKTRRLVASNKWSCHQCVSLNHLLTQEEVRLVLEDLQDLEISKDKISESDYLSYCKHSVQQDDKVFTQKKEQNSIHRFRSAAQENSGTITWTEFLNLESIRILNRRCKDSLVHLLTNAEVAKARKIFQQADSQKLGIATKGSLQALLDCDKSRASSYYPDDSMMYIDEDVDSPVTWSDFLRDRAIYILSSRQNCDEADVRGGRDTADGGVAGMTFSSIDSLDDDDDDYNTCHSDLGPGSGQGTLDSREDELSDFHSSTTMLDEFNKEMDKCCSKHELRGSSDNSPCQRRPCCSDNSESKCNTSQTKTSRISLGQLRDSKILGNLKSDEAQQSDHLDENKPEKDNQSKVKASERGTPERNRSSPYNDSRHTPIPWEDLGDRSPDMTREGGGHVQNHRKSEIIPRRPALPSSGQVRAVSHAGCRHGKGVLAPAYGNLVGKVNAEEWGC